jgi:hypothetical protein
VQAELAEAHANRRCPPPRSWGAQSRPSPALTAEPAGIRSPDPEQMPEAKTPDTGPPRILGGPSTNTGAGNSYVLACLFLFLYLYLYLYFYKNIIIIICYLSLLL